MTTITKERIEFFIKAPLENGLTRGEQMELARIALPSLAAEPVAWKATFTKIDNEYDTFTAMYSDKAEVERSVRLYNACGFREDITPLYAALPAPVVPDEYRHLSELYHAQEKRLFKLAQRIKGTAFDKYAHSPSQAIDVLESAVFGEDADSCCAAMLHGKGEPGKQVCELTMLVRKLASRLKNAKPDCELPDRAIRYLERNRLISMEDVLR